MFQKQSGGLGGLLDLFKQKGLASIASTWPGGKGLPLRSNGVPSKSAPFNAGAGSSMVGTASTDKLPKASNAPHSSARRGNVHAALEAFLGKQYCIKPTFNMSS